LCVAQQSSKCKEVKKHNFHFARSTRSKLRGMRSQCTFIGVVAASLIVGTAALVQAERPFVSAERGPTLDHGVSKLEFGVESARFSSQTTRYTSMTELTYGLLDHLNFEVEAPYFFITGPGGTQGEVGDVTLRPKVLFLKGREANPLFLSGELVVKFPSCEETGTAGTANSSVNVACTGEADLGLIGIATKEFLPVTVHLNLGYTFVGNPPGQTLDNVISYALAFEYGTILPAIVLVGEVAGETNRDPSVGDNPLTLLVGVMYRVNQRVSVDSSLTAGLTSLSPDYGASLGVSYTF
jgi:hypothetical protein